MKVKKLIALGLCAAMVSGMTVSPVLAAEDTAEEATAEEATEEEATEEETTEEADAEEETTEEADAEEEATEEAGDADAAGSAVCCGPASAVMRKSKRQPNAATAIVNIRIRNFIICAAAVM